MKNIFTSILLLLTLFGTSCRYYRSDVLFKTKQEELDSLVRNYVRSTERNYVIRKGDFIYFQLFTNNGEILVDPTSEFARQASTATSSNTTKIDAKSAIKYLVKDDGTAFMPLIGNIYVENYTMYQLDSLLAQKYAKFYQDPFIISKIANRRVFVLGLGQGLGVGGFGGGIGGGTGGIGVGAGLSILEFESEYITIFEVLAKAGFIGLYSKVDRIKVIRGYNNEKEPFKVNIINLATLKGAAASDLRIYPNDVIYIEPGRRPVLDFVREIAIFAQIAFTASTIILLVNQLSK
jgi:polysaccharide export outer membrane protein